MSSTLSPFDTKAFRSALGAFATGVTIITTRAHDGTPVGLTANSFNSVSLAPPLVLWSLSKNAKSLNAFKSANEWAVHVLASHQQALSNRFARGGEDKFRDVPLVDASASPPLLADCAARFCCRSVAQHEGGDHIIFLGEVTDFVRKDYPPLVFHAGSYALATSAEAMLSAPRTANLTPDFGEDFLGYLLGRAHFQFHRGILASACEFGLSDRQWFVVATLVAKDGASAEAIDTAYAHHGPQQSTVSLLEELVGSGWVRTDTDPQGKTIYCLTEDGRGRSLSLLAQVKSLEVDVMERMGEADLQILKSALYRYINATNPGIPDLWARPSV